jgi:hypothetical protein
VTEDLKNTDALAVDFVRFSVQSGVLRFGEFKTKAGRLSPLKAGAVLCTADFGQWDSI